MAFFCKLLSIDDFKNLMYNMKVKNINMEGTLSKVILNNKILQQ